MLRPFVEAPPPWKGSPFPGLRAFTEADAPIFVGRGLETSELVKRVEPAALSLSSRHRAVANLRW